MSTSIQFRTVINVLDRIIDSGDLVLSDLWLPSIRHARWCIELDLLINICALLRCKIPQYVRTGVIIDLQRMEQASAVMNGLNWLSSLNMLLTLL